MATMVAPLVDPSTASPASTNPASNDPESPRNARAGGKLNGRNPRNPPASAAATRPMPGCPRVTEIKNTAVAAKNAEPAATPSAPSSRLNAFERPTSHSTVTTYPAMGPRFAAPSGSDRICTLTPRAYTADATTTWMASFHVPGTGRMSSAKPSSRIRAAPTPTGPSDCAVPRMVRPVGSNTSPTRARETTQPMAMATPPIRGTAGSRVSSIAPTLRATPPVSGMNSAVATAATKNTRRYEPTATSPQDCSRV